MSDQEFVIDDSGCPKCGGGMRRVESRNGTFMGCNNFPRCRGSRDIFDPRFDTKPEAPTYKLGPRETPKLDTVVGSAEQEAIWDAITKRDAHVVVKALAGTGKSFTCRHAMSRVPRHKRVIYLAFNKDIVREFEQGAPPNAEVVTLNGKGSRICKQAFPDMVISADKVQDIIQELLGGKSMTVEEFRSVSTATDKLVSLCQGYLIDGTNLEEVQELADRHEVVVDADIAAEVMRLVPKVLALDRERCNVISFNDQLWLPVILNLPCPKYDVIFVDEAQDLNKVQHHLVMRLLAPGGRVVVVGDDHQAIYGFRGSDVDSISNLCQLLESTGKPIEQLPLTVTRRCPKAVVEFAKLFVPQLEALPDAQEGEVVHTTVEQAEPMYRPGDMVLCRCNAPLTSIAFGLIQRGVKAVIRGRDIGQGLISLIKKLNPRDANDLLIKLDKWSAKEIAKLAGTRREETATQLIVDRVDCLRALSGDCDNITELCARITSLFSNFEPTGAPRGAVVLSSIHRAKGLEADRVFWLEPEISCKSTQLWQLQQEVNLKYVATTRAKRSLIMVRKPRG